MSVSIRLKRMGRVHLPFYNIAVFPTLARRDGQPIEELGLFNPAPRGKQEALRLNLERAKYWLEQGAKPSDTVAKIFRDNGLKGDLWASAPRKKSKSAPKKRVKPAADAKPRKPRTANSKLTADRQKKAGAAS
ncbi:MAG: 30S ribosomal protein S16 [Planctomycetota bacterium]|jgi:small subunit ribosomal protein S16|nr:30S ribosomal protein S16 [Planctomycetota bacterium]